MLSILRILAVVGAVATCGPLCAQQGPQGGFGGGGQGFGGGRGVGLGQNGHVQNYATQDIDGRISAYLSAEPTHSILTPGEFNEWSLTLKEGQVVIADVRSDSFDPALEVVDSKGKVLASNDDRYPGHQRPLILWRCVQAGSYSLHVRSFHDKSGGQFWIRTNVYDSLDLVPGKEVRAPVVDNGQRILLRLPMQAGQVAQIQSSIGPRAMPQIGPTGLPGIGLEYPFLRVLPGAIIAPVTGDYYLLAESASPGSDLRYGVTEVVPSILPSFGGGESQELSPTGAKIVELSVKKGDLLEVQAQNASLNTGIVIQEKPDVSKFDLVKPENSPFTPEAVALISAIPVAKRDLPSRSRDPRYSVFQALKDAKLWIAVNQFSSNNSYRLRVGPAAKNLEEQSSGNRLKVGMTDYWQFEVKSGDVMTFKSKVSGFAEDVKILHPDLNNFREDVLKPDQTTTDWNVIFDRAGRYLVAVSCLGDGGGGEYDLTRKVFHSQQIDVGKPATLENGDGEIRVWELTVTPQKPLLVHITAYGTNPEISWKIKDGSGQEPTISWVDPTNGFGILNVQESTTFKIVVIPHAPFGKYSISVSPLIAPQATKKS